MFLLLNIPVAISPTSTLSNLYDMLCFPFLTDEPVARFCLGAPEKGVGTHSFKSVLKNSREGHKYVLIRMLFWDDFPAVCVCFFTFI